MPQCKNCGSYVTPDFGRVFGGNEDDVYGCLDCAGATGVKNGATKEGKTRRSDLNHPAIEGAD